MFPPR